MPSIDRFFCDTCGFELPSGWGGSMYVADDDGTRIVCPHPEEHATVVRVLASNASSRLREQRTGFLSDCLCLDCLADLRLDLKRDRRRCPKCRSRRVASIREMVDRACPRCGEGRIRRVPTGAIC